ncbi:pilus assembly protein PilC, partial [Escherichia coli]
YSAAIFLIPICISFDTAEKRRYATYLILNRRFSFGF